MSIRAREYHGTEDDARVRDLFIASYALTQRWHCWSIEHQEGMRYGMHAEAELAGDHSWEQHYRAWELPDGRLVGVVTPESTPDVYFQVHPQHREIEAEMLDWTEAHFRTHRPDWWRNWDGQAIRTFVSEQDAFRQALLERRGWERVEPGWCYRRRPMSLPIPELTLPEGYRIRPLNLNDASDVARRTATSNATFGGQWPPAVTAMIRLTPIYRGELDLIVEAADGACAAFCTIWVDPVNRTAVYEPVGTHPAHRGRGLAKQMMWEGLRRLAPLGVQTAFVTSWSGSDGANALYESAGFAAFDRDFAWKKRLR